MATITANITSSAGLIPLSAEVPIGFYTIDSENIYVTGMSRGADGRDFERLTASIERAVGGSTAASHTSGATLTRYYPDAAGGSGGLEIVDGHAEIPATLNINAPAGASSDSALLTIVPHADWADSGNVYLVIIDPGGDPSENFGVLEVLDEDGFAVLQMGAAGTYSIDIDSEAGKYKGRQLEVSASNLETPIVSEAKNLGGDVVSTFNHMRVNSGLGEPYDGSLMYSSSFEDMRFRVAPDGRVFMPNLPTANPNVAGALWVDTAAGFVVKQSQG